MKKLMVIATFLVACITTNAQVYIGGSLGFETSKRSEDTDNLTTWSVIPEIGYKINNLLSVGLQLGYVSQELYKDNKSESFIVSPYTRLTFIKSGFARFFIDCGATYTAYADDKDEDSNEFTWGVGIRPGVIFAASEKVNFVAKLGYLGYSKNSDDLGGGSEFGLSIDNTDLSFGVFYNF